MKKIILLLLLFVFSSPIVCNSEYTQKIIDYALKKDIYGLRSLSNKYKDLPMFEYFNVEQLVILTGDIKVIKHLINNNNFNVHSPDNILLHVACAAGSLELVRYLIEEHKLDINVTIDANINIFDVACQSGSLELVKYLVEKHKLSFGVDDYSILLSMVFKSQSLELVKYLVEKNILDIHAQNIVGATILHIACQSGSLELVKYLVEEHKLDVAAKVNDGTTLLHLACISGSINLVKYLIEVHKFDVKAKAGRDMTLLHMACMSGSLEVVKYFIGVHKLDVHVKDGDGATILHTAIVSANSSLDLVKYLLEVYKLDVNVKFMNKTMFEIAIVKSQSDLINYFLDNICLFDLESNRHCIIFNLIEILKTDKDIDQVARKALKSLSYNEQLAVFTYLRQDKFYSQLSKEVKCLVDFGCLCKRIRKGESYDTVILRQIYAQDHEGYNIAKKLELKSLLKPTRKLAEVFSSESKKLLPEIIGKINSYRF